MRRCLVFYGNDAYLDYVKVAIYAARTEGRWNESIMLLYVNGSQDLTADPWFVKMGVLVRPVKTEFPKKGSYEIFKTDFLLWDFVICLDTDVIINGDLNQITDGCTGISMARCMSRYVGDWLFAWCSGVWSHRSPKQRAEYLRYFKDVVSSKSDAFLNPARNSGTICVKPSGLVRDGDRTYAELLDADRRWVKAFKLVEGDQYILNLVFSEEMTTLDSRYNHLLPFQRYRYPADEAIVVHGMWKNKPWGPELSSTHPSLHKKWLAQRKGALK